MKRKEFNAITSGVTGAFGNQLVLRIVNGEQVLGRFPAASSKPPTAKQNTVKSRFKEAAAYAKNIIKNLSFKELYNALRIGKGNAYTTAMADYYHPPKVEQVTLDGYTGQVGDKVLVLATDNVRVESVAVQMFRPNADLLEEGMAVYDTDTGQWHYTATQPNATVTGTLIVVTAIDIPGNEGKLETTLS